MVSKMTTWRRGILIPTWVLHLPISILLMVLTAYDIHKYRDFEFEFEHYQYIILLITLLLSNALDIAEILFYCFGVLSPVLVVSFSCIEILIWIYCALAAVAGLNMPRMLHADWGITSFVLSCIMIIITVPCLVHASILLHRRRMLKKQGRYSDVHGQSADYTTLRADLIRESHKHSRENGVEPPHMGSHEIA